MKHSAALAALVATSMSLVALPALAQDQPAPAAPKADREIHRTILHDGRGFGHGAGILALACSERGAEELEVAFVRWSHRLDLTAEQQPLFDTLKTSALAAQTSFADTCQAALPGPAADGATPNLLEGLKARLAIEQARLTAMNALLPDFEAFYMSLTDEQKADLLPHRMTRRDFGSGDRMYRGPGDDRDAPGRDAPGRDAPGRDAPGRDAPGRDAPGRDAPGRG